MSATGTAAAASTGKTGRRRQHRKQDGPSFAPYIVAIAKHSDVSQSDAGSAPLGITKKAVDVLNNIVLARLDQLARAAGDVAAANGRRCMTSRDVTAAIKLELPVGSELGAHAIERCITANAKYEQSMAAKTAAQPSS